MGCLNVRMEYDGGGEVRRAVAVAVGRRIRYD